MLRDLRRHVTRRPLRRVETVVARDSRGSASAYGATSSCDVVVRPATKLPFSRTVTR
ncbi:hypothetical protein ACWGDS_14330 [Streptomyces sp. NPDC055059]|uniref:hypothetical protein n=1 Tax=Streptomyces sp. NPDC127172 TaxID=3345382 RepID=UPI00362760D5